MMIKGLILADGFEDAFMGVVEQYNKLPVAVYDKNKCIEILINQDMTQEEAEEFFDFNIIGAWMGERTPMYFTPKEEVEQLFELFEESADPPLFCSFQQQRHDGNDSLGPAINNAMKPNK